MTRTPPVDPSPSCVEVREARDRGEPLAPAAEAHASGCPICTPRPAPLASPASDLDGGDALFAAVKADLERERGFTAWLRALPTGGRVAGAAAVAGLLVTAVGAGLPRGRFAPMPMDRVVLVVTVLAALLALALRLGLRPLQAAAPSAALSLVGFVGGVVAPFLFALGPTPAPFYGIPGITFAQMTVGCFVIGSVTGALVVVALWALDRGGHRSREAALFAATAGGLAANAALELHCPATDLPHLVLGHASVALALVLAYGAIPRRAAD